MNADETLPRGASQPYIDAELYEHEYKRRREDVQFYRDFAVRHVPEGGAILDLCCGSGRITRALLRAGFVVTGVDASAEMLARARLGVSRLPKFCRPSATFVRADMREVQLGRRFDLVMCAFNSAEHLFTDDDVRRGLTTMAEHMTEDGLLVLDVEVPDMTWLARDPDKRWSPTKFRHPTTRQWLRYTTNHRYDPATKISHIRFFYEPLEPGPIRTTQVVHLAQRKFGTDELRGWLDQAGLQVLRHDADFTDEPVFDGAVQQVVVCRRGGSQRLLV